MVYTVCIKDVQYEYKQIEQRFEYNVLYRQTGYNKSKFKTEPQHFASGNGGEGLI